MPTDNSKRQSKKAAELIARERATRVHACEQTVMSALKRYKCRLTTIQQYIDGQAQPIQVVVTAIE